MNWLFVALGAIPAFLLSLGIHMAYMGIFVDPSHQHDLQALQTHLIDQCNASKRITEDVSHEYEVNLDRLHDRMAALRVQHAAKCLLVTKPPSGDYASTGDKGLPKAYGIASQSLYDYGFDAEQVGQQLDACQRFINKVWNR